MFVLELLVGLILLVTGAELLVRGGGELALMLRVPALIVGLTVVAFGTSAPELAVSLAAAFEASTEMALANVNGSNIANIALVLGLASMVRPLRIDRTLLRREVPACLLIQLLVPLFLIGGRISRVEGGLLLLAGVVYNGLLIREARAGRVVVDEADLEVPGENSRWYVPAAFLLGGLLILILGARFFVAGGVGVAGFFGFSERFVGLTVIALGTSAPEIATGMVSAYRGQSELAVGNSLGSNILNVVMVLGCTAAIHPIQIVDPATWLDVLAVVVVTSALIPLVLRGRSISRFEGGLMAAGYVAYLLVAPT